MSNSLSHNITGGNQVREIIGSRLREERERLGLTQTEFAQMGEASKRSQTDWEQGKLVPNGEFLANIAEHGADIGYILTGERNGNKLSAERDSAMAELQRIRQQSQVGNAAALEQQALLKAYFRIDPSLRTNLVPMLEQFAMRFPLPDGGVPKEAVNTVPMQEPMLTQMYGVQPGVNTGSGSGRVGSGPD